MKKILTIIGLAAASLTGAQAAVVINYSTAIGALSGTPTTVTATSSNSTIAQNSTLSRGAGITAASVTGRFSGSNVVTGNETAAISGNDYYSFSILPASGVTLDYGAITLTLQSSNTGAVNYAFLSSIAGFTAGSSIASGALVNNGTPSPLITISNATLGASFDAVTTTTEFRIYVWGASGAAGSTSVNNITVDAIPEPKTWVLIGIGTSFMMWNLRRRRRVQG